MNPGIDYVLRYAPWADSKINTLNTCPYRFYRAYDLKDYTCDSIALNVGSDCHTVLEVAVTSNSAAKAKEEYDKIYALRASVHQNKLDCLEDKLFLAVDKMLESVNKLRGQASLIRAEDDLAIKFDGSHTYFLDKTGLYRGKLDFLMLLGTTAIVVDYKTGQERDEVVNQLKSYAVLVMSTYKKINTVRVSPYYIETETLKPATVYTRDMLPDLFLELKKRIEDAASLVSPDTKIKAAHCNYCPYQMSCD